MAGSLDQADYIAIIAPRGSLIEVNNYTCKLKVILSLELADFIFYRVAGLS